MSHAVRTQAEGRNSSFSFGLMGLFMQRMQEHCMLTHIPTTCPHARNSIHDKAVARSCPHYPSPTSEDHLTYFGTEPPALSIIQTCAGIPKLLHYGLLFEVQKYKFDKHWHYDFDVTKCPPWNLKDPARAREGIFQNPPRPSTLPNKARVTGRGEFRHLYGQGRRAVLERFVAGLVACPSQRE